jgi:leucyl-tRNA synthetase
VLAGYGTGAVMAVPCGDERDYAFTTLKDKAECLPSNIFDKDILRQLLDLKMGQLVDSDFLNGLGQGRNLTKH